MTDVIHTIWAGDPLPAGGPAVFLAGPTPRSPDVPSWRPAALRELAAQWDGPGPLAALVPESADGRRAESYDGQVGWETAARARADAILFWVPRDLRTMPGFTTNVEFGLDIGTGRAVLGCPPNCPDPQRNRYLIWVARHHGAPVCETLPATVTAALALARRSSTGCG